MFLPLLWEIHQGRLQVQWFPRTKDIADPDIKEIKQSTGNDIQVSRQRGGTIADEILVYLDKKPIAETAELREATQSSPQGFSLAIKKLINAGEVRKIKRGLRTQKKIIVNDPIFFSGLILEVAQIP